MASFRDRFLTPKVANAMTSPSAIVAVGAGAAVAIAVGLGPIGAVAIGAGAWAARVLAAVPRNRSVATVNPRQLQEPWRQSLAGVHAARRRFDEAMTGLRAGPLRERLNELGSRLDVAVAEAGRVAAAGNALQHGRRRIDTNSLQQELAQARAMPPSPGNDQVIAALEAQFASATRLDTTIQTTWNRLRVLDARIDESVTRTVELAATQQEGDELGGLDTEINSIVGEMEALRQAIEETGGTPGAALGDGPGTEPGTATGSGTA
ncbi:MAG: hypothetical protein ACOYML_05975 [Microthrixaceae bacterium]